MGDLSNHFPATKPHLLHDYTKSIIFINCNEFNTSGIKIFADIIYINIQIIFSFSVVKKAIKNFLVTLIKREV